MKRVRVIYHNHPDSPHDQDLYFADTFYDIDEGRSIVAVVLAPKRYIFGFAYSLAEVHRWLRDDSLTVLYLNPTYQEGSA